MNFGFSQEKEVVSEFYIGKGIIFQKINLKKACTLEMGRVGMG